jgi:predicted MFS family arabinose efflux permease
VLGLLNGILNVDVSTLLLNRTPEAARGRALANVNAMARGSALGAMALGGAAGTLLGPRATFVAAGALSTVVAGALVVRIRRVLSHEVASGHDPRSPTRADRRGARARRRRLVRPERA